MAVKEYERWVLKRTMHFGIIKESFLAGTEIHYIPEDRNMRINGRVYDNVTDFDILRRHNWVAPYDEEEAEELKATAQPLQRPNEDPAKHEKMQVIKSDEDEMGDPIDIRETQIANRKKESKVKQHKEAVKTMEVIRGDESPKERRDRISVEKKMKVVEDDGSLSGDTMGSKQIPLNAGLVKERTAEEVAKMRAEAAAKAKVKTGVVEVDESKPHGLADEVTVVPISPTVDVDADNSSTDAADDFQITRIPVMEDDLAQQINEANE